MAPGEAEAECALLQRNGVVDVVLSEDVDTIMFGCTKTLRNWSADGKGSRPPTHVSVYDTEHQSIIDTGLDREGMVLVALMSGGDYCPEGIPGCGVKIAVEAAKAGYGKSLCKLKTADKDGIKEWRKNLVHELQTNESGFFRTKHKSLTIPQDFPDMEVVRLYTHPAISPQVDIEAIRQRVLQPGKIELEDLREFTRETFDWDYRGGALKFIKVMGHAMLVQKLHHGDAATESSEQLVKKIGSQRLHFSTDNTAELRVTYIPEETVPIDLSQEVEETVSYAREGLALDADEELDSSNEAAPSSTLASVTAVKEFDPSKPEAVWMLESVAKRGAPLAFQAFEEAELYKALRKASPKKAAAGTKKAAKSKSDMPYGAIESHVRTTKRVESTVAAAAAAAAESKLPSPPRSPSKQRISKTPKSVVSPASPKRLHPPPRSIAAASNSSSQKRNIKTATECTAAVASPDSVIILSSSPAAGPSSPAAPPESPTRGPRPVPAQSAPVPGSVQSILSESPGKAPVSKTKPWLRKQVPPKERMKQTSLDVFTTKPLSSAPLVSARQAVSTLPTPAKIIDDSVFDSDSDGADLPTLPTEPTAKDGGSHGSSTKMISSQKNKKLLFIPDPKTGRLREVEADESERDRLEKQLGKNKVTRYSDISVVDLTGE